MFLGDFERSASWSDGGINGCRKFLDRVWKLQEITNSSEENVQIFRKIKFIRQLKKFQKILNH